MKDTTRTITTAAIKADIRHAKQRMGLGAVIQNSWRQYNHDPADRARRIAYLREANERAAVIERQRIV